MFYSSKSLKWTCTPLPLIFFLHLEENLKQYTLSIVLYYTQNLKLPKWRKFRTQKQAVHLERLVSGPFCNLLKTKQVLIPLSVL